VGVSCTGGTSEDQRPFRGLVAGLAAAGGGALCLMRFLSCPAFCGAEFLGWSVSSGRVFSFSNPHSSPAKPSRDPQGGVGLPLLGGAKTTALFPSPPLRPVAVRVGRETPGGRCPLSVFGVAPAPFVFGGGVPFARASGLGVLRVGECALGVGVGCFVPVG